MFVRPFGKEDGPGTFRLHLEAIGREIGELENDYVLKASPTELENHFVDKARIEPLNVEPGSFFIEERRSITLNPRARATTHMRTTMDHRNSGLQLSSS